MVSRTVSLEASAYERLRAAKRPGESFSQTVNRLLEASRPSFRALAGILTPSEATSVRRAVRGMREQERRAERVNLTRFEGPHRGRHAGY
jgi:predicted CopG family antitoxin